MAAGDWESTSMRIEQTDDIAMAALKAAPAAGGVVVYSLTLSEWVAALTILYLLLQIGLLIPKYWGIARAWIADWRAKK